MTKFKKIVAIGTMVMAIGATSVTAFAAQGNPVVGGRGAGNSTAAGIRQQDGTYLNTGVRPGTGRGAGGTGRLLGIGGMGLQDGSCYITN